MSLRESPVHRHHNPEPRPTWLLVLLGVVALLVVIGIGFGIFSLVRGSSSEESSAEPTAVASACQPELVPAGDVLPKPEKVVVNVYNATSTDGLASRTATALEKSGFRLGQVANDPVGKPIPGVAQIRFGPNAANAARRLLVYVPGADMVELERKGPKVDLATGDSFTDLASPAEVKAALGELTPETSPGCPADGASSATPTPSPSPAP